MATTPLPLEKAAIGPEPGGPCNARRLLGHAPLDPGEAAIGSELDGPGDAKRGARAEGLTGS